MGKLWVTGLLVLMGFNANAFDGAMGCSRLFNSFQDEPHIIWFKSEGKNAIYRIMKNISPADADKGAIIAAPTRVSPNYYYHWIRDAGLTMEAVVEQYRETNNQELKAALRQKMEEYRTFSIKVQKAPTLTGLGEPKIHVDGTPYNDPWGRPQNDSPALRALSFIHWAQVLISEGKINEVRKGLYNHKDSLIKNDLEYISKTWREPSFDLWEEVNATHFYTRMVQRRALLDGAKLARRMGDEGAANWYIKQAKEIEADLPSFYDEGRGYYKASKDFVGGLDYKHSGLDVAVVLGMLHGHTNDGFIRFSDAKVISTLEHLERSFKEIYTINKHNENLGPAIGRYPEDMYGGDNFRAGNPWPLATFAVAEAYYRAAAELANDGQKARAREFMRRGDALVARVKFHAFPDGSLSEQFNRETGFMMSVSDLTWNYAALITSSLARAQINLEK